MVTRLKKYAREAHAVIGMGERTMAVISMVIVVAALTIEIVTRYVLRVTVLGTDEIAGNVGVWVCFTGAVIAGYERSHIKTEVLHVLIKNQRVVAVAGSAAAGASCLACCIVASWAYRHLSWTLAVHQKLISYPIPTALFQVAILVGLILMAAHFFGETVELAGRAPGSRPTS